MSVVIDDSAYNLALQELFPGGVSLAPSAGSATSTGIGGLFSSLAPALGPVGAMVAAAFLIPKLFGSDKGKYPRATDEQARASQQQSEDLIRAYQPKADLDNYLATHGVGSTVGRKGPGSMSQPIDPATVKALEEAAKATGAISYSSFQSYQNAFNSGELPWQRATSTPIANQPSPFSQDMFTQSPNLSQMTHQQLQSIAQPVPPGSGPGPTFSGQGTSPNQAVGQAAFSAPTSAVSNPATVAAAQGTQNNFLQQLMGMFSTQGGIPQTPKGPVTQPGARVQPNWLTQMLQGAGQNFAQGLGKIPGVGPESSAFVLID